MKIRRILSRFRGTDNLKLRRSDMGKNKIFLNVIMMTIFILFGIDFLFAQKQPDHVGALYQPDPIYYNVNRKKLLTVSQHNMKVFPIRWLIASAKEGTPIYDNSSMIRIKFKATFLQRFEVLDKLGPRLQVKELDASSPQTGWVNMKDLIYLPRSLKDKETAVYQKVVFTHMVDQLEIGNIGDIIFYKTPGKSSVCQIRGMGTLRIAYVYAWQKSTYDDSQFVLIGSYPSIEGVLSDRKAFKKVIYGWCKTSAVFPWNSRMALIPNPATKYPTYIFTTGPALNDFYNKSGFNTAPNRKTLVTFDSQKMWEISKWPFFLGRKLSSGNQEFLRLVCQVGTEYGNVSPVKFGDLKKELEFLKSSVKAVDIVFLLDATKSMRLHIEGVAEIIRQVMKEVEKNSSIDQQRLRFGAAVYRDYVDGVNRFEMEPLSKNIPGLKKRLNDWAQRAVSHWQDKGDAAYPEALFNGIVQSVRRSGYGEHNSRFLIVIGDAGNHSRGKDSYTCSSVGKLLANNRINCIMVKVNHPLVGVVGGDKEKKAMDLFQADAVCMRNNYVQKYIEIGSKYNYNYFNSPNVSKLFILDNVNSPTVLKNQLLLQYSRQISDAVDTMIGDYQRLIEGESIEPTPVPKMETKTPVASAGESRNIINPIVFESLRVRFGDDFENILEELKRKRAYFMKFGYAREFDPRSPGIPQFKNVYLFRKSEVLRITQVLDWTLETLRPRMVGSLWRQILERLYGEKYEPGRTFNHYAKMQDGVTYRQLSVLFDKTQEQISRLRPQEFEEIERKLLAVKEKLENLINDRAGVRFFGPHDDPYIWLYEDDIP